MINLLVHNPAKSDLAQTSFGGLPVKNESEEFNWPHCSSCKLPMQFLGKIAQGNYLYQIFMCQNDPGCCEEWGPDEGGNKVIVTSPSSLEKTVAPSKGLTTREAEYSALIVPVECYDYEHAREKWANDNNKNYRDVLGQINGVPAWLQGEEVPICNSCNSPMQFIAQLEQGPNSDTEMNFGGGSAYVFNCTCSASAKFLWQC
jgi:hypothetical protein